MARRPRAGGSARDDYDGRALDENRRMIMRQQGMTSGQLTDEQHRTNAAIIASVDAERASRVYADMQEGQARVAGDTALGARIDALGVSTSNALNAEAAARQQADTTNASDIANEAKLRRDADTAEATARAAADTALDTRLAAIEAQPRLRKFAATIGNGLLSSITVTHNLGTADVIVQVFAGTGIVVPLSITRNQNSVVMVFALALGANSRVVIVG